MRLIGDILFIAWYVFMIIYLIARAVIEIRDWLKDRKEKKHLKELCERERY